VLVEVDYRGHRYAYVPAVGLELQPSNKLFLSLSLTTLPHTRDVHLLIVAEMGSMTGEMNGPGAGKTFALVSA
jgi:hypothetical protein